MKAIIFKIMLLVIIGTQAGCQREKRWHAPQPAITDNSARIEQEEEEDSRVVNAALLQTAINTAKGQPKVNTFCCDSFCYQNNLLLGNTPLLFIKTIHPSAIWLYLYQFSGDSLVQVFKTDYPVTTFINDTVFDANGDGLKDLLVHWYPSAGCCLRDILDVYLANAHALPADTPLQFINPVFSPHERVVRGLGYGWYPPYYKLQWRGNQVDTIEYIYPPESYNGKFYLRRKTNDVEAPAEQLTSLPAEYRHLKINW